jgi:hypothetical protein
MLGLLLGSSGLGRSAVATGGLQLGSFSALLVVFPHDYSIWFYFYKNLTIMGIIISVFRTMFIEKQLI